MAILNIEAGAHDPFSLKIKESETLQGLKERIARKIGLEQPQIAQTTLKYEWVGVYYVLEDDDDWEIFLERVAKLDGQEEIKAMLLGDHIPKPQHHPPFGSRRADTAHTTDTHSIITSATNRSSFATGYAGGPYMKPGKAHSVHLIASSDRDGSSASRPRSNVSDAASQKTGTTARTNGYAKSITGTVQTDFSLHSQAFSDFQHSRGVRTFVGSIGPIENVRMMLKSGHRACYMSREFAQKHNFIPKDAAPGFYGFSGITNLGSWPIKVGEKTVQQQVMLVENALFPVILGRSFMEKRGVRTDPLDQTSVTFMDTGEAIPTDVVVVKDSNGNPVPIP